MLLTHSDLSGIVVSKPVIDARADPTRPPTGVVDLATGAYQPITQPRPLTTGEKVLVGLGVIGAIGVVAWLISKAPRTSVIYSSDLGDLPPVIVRRRSPVVVYQDDPTVVVDEAPALLVNPRGGKFLRKRNGASS